MALAAVQEGGTRAMAEGGLSQVGGGMARSSLSLSISTVLLIRELRLRIILVCPKCVGSGGLRMRPHVYLGILLLMSVDLTPLANGL